LFGFDGVVNDGQLHHASLLGGQEKLRQRRRFPCRSPFEPHCQAEGVMRKWEGEAPAEPKRQQLANSDWRLVKRKRMANSE